MSVSIVDNNVTVTVSQEVEVANTLVTNTITNEYPNTITVKSNEFAVVGDGLFATTKEEVPGWMRELVGDLARSANAAAYNAMTGFNYNLYNAMIALQVAENKYEQVINTRITDQEAFVQAVETLNSTVQNSEAEIVSIKQTYATKDFATATAAQTLEASLNGGAIKSSLGQLASTMTNQYGTMAQRMDILESTFDDLGSGVQGYANATSTLETYVGLVGGVPDSTGLIAKVELLERQNDGVIETTTGTYDVILRASEPDFSELITTVEPYASWLAADTLAGGINTRLAHIGDVYVKYQDIASGAKEYVASYKFIRTAVDTTTPHSTDSEGFTWAIIVDQAAEMAYEAALNAYDLADGKRRVFTATPVGPYDVGDLWVRVVGTSNQIWRANTTSTVYNAAHWQVASTDDTAVVALSTGLANGTATVNLASAYVGDKLLTTYVADELDKEVVILSGTAAPTTNPTTPVGKLNDIYIQKTTATSASGIAVDVVNTWKHNGTIWEQVGNNDNITALADLADGKRTVFSGNTVPTGAVVNDVWIPSADNGSYVKGEVYQYIGSPLAWTKATKYTEDLSNFVGEISPKVTTLQEQVDGKIEYLYYNSYADVVGAIDEASALRTIKTGWGAAENGNVVYFKNTTNGYWYSSTTDNFQTIRDTSIYEALQRADEAKNTADGVVVSYYAIEQSTAPVTSKLWLDGTKVLRKFTTVWQVVPVKTGDTLTTYTTATKDIKVYVFNGTSWVTETAAGVVASSKAVTDLNLQLTSPTGALANAVSTLENSLVGTMPYDGISPRVDAKFKYNSTININGSYYNSGFGLETTTDPDTGLPTSEFLINAEKFKFTNTNKTGLAAPFTIDTSGAQPQVTFNGKVQFNNVTGAPTSVNLIQDSLPRDNTSSWGIGWHNTGLQLVFGQNATDWACEGIPMPYVVCPGTPSAGTVFDLRITNGVRSGNTEIVDFIPVTPNAYYEASAHISAHRLLHAYVSIAWFDTSKAYISEVAGTTVSTAGNLYISSIDRSFVIAEAPSNARYAIMYIRGVANGTGQNPYLFGTHAMFALSNSTQILPSTYTAGTTGSGTVIDGSKITTGTIQAGAIAAGAITADKVSADVFSGQTIIGGNIYGTRIESAIILGAVIKSSWIDYSNTGVLTNWQHFTPATVPSQYVGNFAKNTNGSLVVDSLGYVRLPGSNVVRTEAHTQTIPSSNSSLAALTPFAIPLRSYDYYQDDTPNRYIKSAFVLDGSGTILLEGGDFPSDAGFGNWYGKESAKAVFYVGNVKYEVYGYEYNSYDYTGYVKENGVVIGTTNWHRNGQLTISKKPYGIPVTIFVNYDYAIKVTITIGASGSFITGYSGIRNVVNVVEAWAGNSSPEYRCAASTNFPIFTAHI